MTDIATELAPTPELAQGYLTDDQIAKALREARGNMAKAGRRLNVSRAAISQRVKKNPALGEIKADTIEELLDLSEDNLAKGIRRGGWRETKYMLDTHGKSRGYTRRVELSQFGPLQVSFTEADQSVL